MKSQLLFHALPLFLSIHTTTAWGTLGHKTVASIAANFLKPETEAFCKNILGDSPNYLSNVSTWADTFRYTSAGSFTKNFHYIDAMDSPPDSCEVEFNRDCEGGCIVSAINNYTERLLDTRLPDQQSFQALSYLIHFIADIHQPLHNENLERGGNGIKVEFNGRDTNLHTIWDTTMPEQLVGDSTTENVQYWSSDLTSRIRSGGFERESQTWVTGISLEDPIETGLGWANDANNYVCTTVLPKGLDAVEGKELSGTYYDNAVPAIELLIAKGTLVREGSPLDFRLSEMMRILGACC